MSKRETTGLGGPIGPRADLDVIQTHRDDPATPTIGRACDEMVARWRKGDRVLVEALLRESPGLGTDGDDLFELIYTEYLVREELGEPALRPLAERFPAQADRLRRQVAMHQLLADPGDADLAREKTVYDGPTREPADAVAWPMPAGYQFRRLLGRGGMGVVYEALQVRLNRVVALKMIRAGVHASPEDRVRFEAEAEAIARLRHPNIVQVHAYGDSAGQPFFEMEYVDGGSLADRLDGTPRPPRDAATLVETVARAIHEAHCRGVVHRDLKPSNILLMADGSPKIVDFGLAKLIGTDSGLTRTDSVLGSPAYMAPEQAGGRGAEVGPAADVYALGAILYEMLTGRQAFVAGTALETLDLVRHAEPVPPSRLRPGLPRDLETIGLRCLAKDPTRRYPSAEALADDLGRWSRGESILARPAGLVEKGYRWSRRNKAVAGLLASVVLLLVGGTTGMAVLWRQARAEAALSRSLASKEARANGEMARISAGLVLDRGQALAAGGDVGRGLPYMARAVQIDAGAQAGLSLAARENLATWALLVPRTVVVAPLGALASVVQLTRDGRVGLIGGRDGSLTVWDVVASRAIHSSGPRPGGRIVRMAVSGDGRVVATNAMDEGLIRLHEVATGRVIGQPLPIRPGYIRLALNPDGSILAAGSAATLWLWEVATGRPIGDPVAIPDKTVDITYSPDGATIILVAMAGLAERHDGRTGRLLGPPLNLEGPAWCSAFHPDGSRFAIGYGPHSLSRQARHDASGVRVFETATGRPIGPRLAHGSGVCHLSYRSDGRLLLSGDSEGLTRLSDGEGRPVGDPLRGEGKIESTAFSPDGSIALTKSDVGMTRLWDAKTGRQIGATLEHPANTQVTWSPDGRRVALISDAHARTVDVSQVIVPARPIQKQGDAHRFLDQGRSLLITGQDGVARVVGTGDGRPLGWPMPHIDRISAMDASRDGRRIATGGRDATIRIWDAQGGLQFPPIPVHHWVGNLRFSPDGRRLLASDEQQDVWLLDVATGKPLASPMRHPERYPVGRVRLLFFSDDGGIGYSVSTSGTIGRIDASTGRAIGDFWDVASLVGHEAVDAEMRTLAMALSGEIRMIDLKTGHGRSIPADGVRYLTFTPDGRTLVGGCADKMVRFWSSATGGPGGPPILVPSPLDSLTISPNGRTLLTTSDDGRALAWDLASRKQVGPARFQDPNLTHPSFSPDGRTVAMTDELTRLDPVPGPDLTPVASLPARFAAMTGVVLDEQGGIAQVGEPVPSPASDPSGPDDWHDRVAIDLGLRGDHAAALWHLDRSVAERPDDWYVHALRSETLVRLGRTGEAEAEADRARVFAGPTQAVRWDAHRGFNAVADARWADAITAFDRVLAQNPSEPALYHDARGWVKVRRQEWAGASSDFARGTWRQYTMLKDILRAGMVALVAEDRRFYSEIVDHLILPWNDGRLKRPQVAGALAWIGTLGPDAIKDPGLLVRLAEAAMDGDSVDGIEARVVLGRALYRASRFEESIHRLTEPYRGRRPDETSDARVVLAMSHWHLGHPDEARHWLRLALGETLPPEALDARVWKTLLREAEAVVLDPDFPADPFEPAPGPAFP